jgi:hypothetical protein
LQILLVNEKPNNVKPLNKLSPEQSFAAFKPTEETFLLSAPSLHPLL